METLPAEVLHQICSYLQPDPRDVACYRLVCNRFAAVGIEHILPTVYVEHHPQSLARLKETSEHPVMRQHVRTVSYLIDEIPIFNNFGAWRERVGGLYADFQLKNGWKEYQRCKAAHDELWNADEVVETIVRSIASLPNLRKMGMYVFNHPGTGAKEGHLFRRHPFAGTLVAYRYFSYANRSFGIKQFFTLLSAMKLCQSTLRSLEVADLPWRVFKNLPPVVDLKKALSCLSHLRMHVTTIDLESYDSWNHKVEFEECKELLSTGCIERFVASAHNLETIELSFDMNGPDSGDWIYHLPDLVGGQTYSKLRRLALNGVRMSEDSLGTFLERHAATLKSLELTECGLTSPSKWFNIFTKIPKILDLEETVLDGYLWMLEGGPSDFLDMDAVIMKSDLRIGRVLEMVICRNFTRKYGHPCANEEEIRSQVLSEITLNSPETTFRRADNGSFIYKIRNRSLMCQLYDKKINRHVAKDAQQAGYSDPLQFKAQSLVKNGWSEDDSLEDNKPEDEGSEYEVYGIKY